jgi:hypothetical protein
MSWNATKPALLRLRCDHPTSYRVRHRLSGRDVPYRMIWDARSQLTVPALISAVNIDQENQHTPVLETFHNYQCYYI